MGKYRFETESWPPPGFPRSQRRDPRSSPGYYSAAAVQRRIDATPRVRERTAGDIEREDREQKLQARKSRPLFPQRTAASAQAHQQLLNSPNFQAAQEYYRTTGLTPRGEKFISTNEFTGVDFDPADPGGVGAVQIGERPIPLRLRKKASPPRPDSVLPEDWDKLDPSQKYNAAVQARADKIYQEMSTKKFGDGVLDDAIARYSEISRQSARQKSDFELYHNPGRIVNNKRYTPAERLLSRVIHYKKLLAPKSEEEEAEMRKDLLKVGYSKEYIANIMTDQEYRQNWPTGKITTGYYTRGTLSRLPFIGLATDSGRMLELLPIVEKIAAEKGTSKEIDEIGRFLAEQEIAGDREGLVVMADVMSTIPGWVIELSASRGLGAAVRVGLQRKAKKLVGKHLKKVAVQKAVGATSWGVGHSSRVLHPVSQAQVGLDYLGKSVPQGEFTTEDGKNVELIWKKPEHAGWRLVNAVGSTWVEIFTEQLGSVSGKVLGAGLSKLARTSYKAASKHMPVATAKLAKLGSDFLENRLQGLGGTKAVQEWLGKTAAGLRRYGIHSPLGEFEEELWASVANSALFGGDPSLHRLFKNVVVSELPVLQRALGPPSDKPGGGTWKWSDFNSHIFPMIGAFMATSVIGGAGGAVKGKYFGPRDRGRLQGPPPGRGLEAPTPLEEMTEQWQAEGAEGGALLNETFRPSINAALDAGDLAELEAILERYSSAVEKIKEGNTSRKGMAWAEELGLLQPKHGADERQGMMEQLQADRGFHEEYLRQMKQGLQQAAKEPAAVVPVVEEAPVEGAPGRLSVSEHLELAVADADASNPVGAVEVGDTIELRVAGNPGIEAQAALRLEGSATVERVNDAGTLAKLKVDNKLAEKFPRPIVDGVKVDYDEGTHGTVILDLETGQLATTFGAGWVAVGGVAQEAPVEEMPTVEEGLRERLQAERRLKKEEEDPARLYGEFKIPEDPTHYEMLGLEDGETDLDVIERHYEERMSQAHDIQGPGRVGSAQGLMNQLTQARIAVKKLAEEIKLKRGAPVADRAQKVEAEAAAPEEAPVTSEDLEAPRSVAAMEQLQTEFSILPQSTPDTTAQENQENTNLRHQYQPSGNPPVETMEEAIVLAREVEAMGFEPALQRGKTLSGETRWFVRIKGPKSIRGHAKTRAAAAAEVRKLRESSDPEADRVADERKRVLEARMAPAWAKLDAAKKETGAAPEVTEEVRRKRGDPSRVQVPREDDAPKKGRASLVMLRRLYQRPRHLRQKASESGVEYERRIRSASRDLGIEGHETRKLEDLKSAIRVAVPAVEVTAKPTPAAPKAAAFPGFRSIREGVWRADFTETLPKPNRSYLEVFSLEEGDPLGKYKLVYPGGDAKNHATVESVMSGVEKFLSEEGLSLKPTPAAPTAAEEAKGFSDAQTGQPFEGSFYRGSGRQVREDVFDPHFLQANILGDATYVTPKREFAQEFGPKVTEVQVSLSNPLVITNDGEWRDLTEQAGWKSFAPISSEEVQRLRQIVDDMGHDGVIIRVPEDEGTGKKLQGAFGEDTVVDFKQVLAAPEAAEAVHEIGDSVKVADIDAVLADQVRIGGVNYELYNSARLKDKRGVVRVFDADSGNTVSINKYATYDKAEAAYKEAVESAKSAEVTPAAPTAAPVRGAAKLITAEGVSEELKPVVVMAGIFGAGAVNVREGAVYDFFRSSTDHGGIDVGESRWMRSLRAGFPKNPAAKKAFDAIWDSPEDFFRDYAAALQTLRAMNFVKGKRTADDKRVIDAIMAAKTLREESRRYTGRQLLEVLESPLVRGHQFDDFKEAANKALAEPAAAPTVKKPVKPLTAPSTRGDNLDGGHVQAKILTYARDGTPHSEVVEGTVVRSTETEVTVEDAEGKEHKVDRSMVSSWKQDKDAAEGTYFIDDPDGALHSISELPAAAAMAWDQFKQWYDPWLARVSGRKFRKLFFTGGILGHEAHTDIVMSEARVQADLFRIKALLGDLNKELRKLPRGSPWRIGKILESAKDLNKEQLEKLNTLARTPPAEMAAKAKELEIPEGLVEPLQGMRERVDKLTGELIALLKLQGESDSEFAEKYGDNLIQVMFDNQGVYLNRSFEVFDNKKWGDRLRANPIVEFEGKKINLFDEFKAEYIRVDRAEKIVTLVNKELPARFKKLEKKFAADRKDNALLEKPLSEDRLKQNEAAEIEDLKTELVAKAKDSLPALDKERSEEIDADISRMISSKRAAAAGKRQPMGKMDMLVFRSRVLTDSRFHKLYREMLGEYKDPILNIMRSVHRMSSVIARYQAQKSLVELNDRMTEEYEKAVQEGKKGFFKARQPWFSDTQSSEHHVLIEGVDMGPLAGKWASEEFVEGMEQAFGHLQASDNEIFNVLAYKIWGPSVGFAKKSQTTLSLSTQARNFIANASIAFVHGHLVVNRSMSDAARLTGIYLTKGGKETTISDEEARELIERLIRAGTLNETVVVRDIQNMFQASWHSTPAEFLSEGPIPKDASFIRKLGIKIKRGLRGFDYAASGLYEAGDAYWKINGWFLERHLAKVSMPNATEAELDAYAGKRIRDKYPTYSNSPDAIRFLRWFPAMSTFPTFMGEFIHTQYWRTPKAIAKDIRSPHARVRVNGYLTGIRMLLAHGGLAQGVMAGIAMLMRLTGDWERLTEDEIDESRLTKPFWDRWGTILSMAKGKGKDRESWYINLSWTMPYQRIPNIYHFLTKTPTSGLDKFSEGVHLSFGEFISPDMVGMRFMEVVMNQKLAGGKVYNKKDPDWWKKSIDYIKQPFVPGTLRSFSRIYSGAMKQKDRFGQIYDPMIELPALLFGIRVVKDNPERTMEFFAERVNRGIGDHNSLTSRWLRDQSKRGPGVLERRLGPQEDSRRRDLELYRITIDYMVNTMQRDPYDLRQLMRERRVTQDVIDQLFEGIYFPYYPGQRTIERMYRENPENAEENQRILDAHNKKEWEEEEKRRKAGKPLGKSGS